MDKEGTPTSEEVKDLDANESEQIQTLPEDANEGEDTQKSTEQSQQDDDVFEFEPLNYLGNEKVINKKSEAKDLMEKGLNYEYKVKQATEFKSRAEKAEEELAELRLKLAEKEVQTQKDNLAKELLKDGYDDELVDKVLNSDSFKKVQELIESTRKESKKATMLTRRSAELEALKEKPFFNEVKKQLEEFITIPANEKIPLEVAYELSVGKLMSQPSKFAEIMENAKKSAIASYQDQSRRTKVLKGDSAVGEEVVIETMLDPDAIKMTLELGGDPKEIAKYVKQNIKK